MRKHVLFALLAVFMTGGCAEQDAGLTPEDLIAIDTLRDALISAIVTGDAAAYANLCTEDVQLLHPGSQIIAGRAELEAHNSAMFEAVSVISLDLTPVVIYGTGDLAYEVGNQVLAIEPAVPGFSSSRKYVHVFRRGNDSEWRFAALMSSNN